jgi:hypothetical protein
LEDETYKKRTVYINRPTLFLQRELILPVKKKSFQYIKTTRSRLTWGEDEEKTKRRRGFPLELVSR